MLDIEGVSVVLGGATVLSGVSASVERGGWLGVIGPNGAGKSTLARAVAGLVPYEGGSALVAVSMGSPTAAAGPVRWPTYPNAR